MNIYIKKPLPFNQQSNIAVIGAGPSGIHMAYELKKMGYNNIDIFEKTDHVGGMSYSPEINGVRYDLGTMVALIHHPELQKFLVELNIKTEPFQITDILTKQNANDLNMDSLLKYFYLRHVESIGKEVSQLKYGLEFIYAFVKYAILRNEMLDEFNYPREEYSSEFNKPLSSFLNDHNIEAIKPLCDYVLTSWLAANGSSNVRNFEAMPLINPRYFTTTTFDRVSAGYQSVWETAVTVGNLKVVYNHELETIENKNNKIEIVFKDKTQIYEYDFVVMAIPFPIKYLKNPSTEQQDVFGHLKYSLPNVATLISADKNYKEEKIKYGADMDINNSYPVVGTTDFTPKTQFLAVFQSPFTEEEFGIVNASSKEIARKQMVESLNDFYNYQNVTIVQEVWWDAFYPHFMQGDVETKYPWKLLELEGTGNLWFVGASAAALSIPGVIDFNHKILNMYELPVIEQESTTGYEFIKIASIAVGTIMVGAIVHNFIHGSLYPELN